jgi:hypothetical protein
VANVLEPHFPDLPLSAEVLARIRERTDEFGT